MHKCDSVKYLACSMIRLKVKQRQITSKN